MINSSLNLSGFTPRLSSTGQTVMYVFLFSKPDTPGAPHFNGADIIEFLYYFQCLRKKHGVNNNNLIKMFSNYCEREKRSQMRAQEGFIDKN